MALYNSTNTIDNSIFLKSKLKTNMVGDNYYIENLQNKRNLDWDYRYNRVEIEEELNKQICYSQDQPLYTPTEVVITDVKSEDGKVLSSDWAKIAFKDLKHTANIGSRYRFDLSFPNMALMSEEEKQFNTSIWIGVNKSPIKAGNSLIIRRCNTALGFVGSPDKSRNYITEVHYEPCALETDLKYMQVYYNQTIPVPQAEWYATFQLNYFTNNIQVNDRFLFGVMNPDDPHNNQAYRVKAVVKSTTNHTFVLDSEQEILDTDLIIVALDKDTIHPNDDFNTRIAASAPIYKVMETDPVYTYYIKMEEPATDKIILGDTEIYTTNVYYNQELVENALFDYEIELVGINEEEWGDYFEFIQTDRNSFIIKNLRPYNEGELIIKAIWKNTPSEDIIVEESYAIELGGFY